MMKISGLAFAAATFAVMSGGAHAADPLARRLPPSPAYAPAKAKDWSGAYIGVHGGFDANGFKSSGASPNIPALNFSGRKNTRGVGGGHAGIQAGYNFQSGNIVYGVEAESALTFGSKKKSTTHLGVEQTSRHALKGRLGYSFGSTLVYGVAGIGIAPVRYTSPAVGATPVSRKSVTRVGPLLGLGVEQMLTENVSLKGEVDYLMLGKQKVNFAAGRTSITAGELSAKVGLNYRF
ncbi:MAG: porin family protein [Proteobacteria bacterium]|nr:porin family protein [Pseudomonadota bacterium]